MGYSERTAAKVVIDVSPASAQGVQDGSGSVFVREVEALFAPLETGPQIG
jgi:hypothetical protein